MEFISLSDLRGSFSKAVTPCAGEAHKYSPEALTTFIEYISRSGIHAIFGRPCSGKTSLMIELALLATARKSENIPVYIFSLESSSEMLAKRITECFFALADNNKETALQLPDCDTEEVLDNLSIFICDESKVSPKDVCDFASSLDKGIIFVDYAQLLSSEGIDSNDEDLSENAADQITHSFINSADNITIPIVLLWQQGRHKSLFNTDKIKDLPNSEKYFSVFKTIISCQDDALILHKNLEKHMNISDNNENLNICPVCGKYEFKCPDSFEVCPVCGWENSLEAKLAPESDMLPNHLSLSKYKEFYNEICESIPRYRWDIYSDKWYEYIAEHFISCSSNGTNLLFTDVSKMFADLTRGTVSLVASRPLRGEIPFFTSLFYYAERCGRKIDIWDLYGDTEFLKDTRYSDTVTVHDAVTDIYDILTSGKDIIILYGIQAIQKEPFNPEEMNEILSKFKALSHDLNSAVIVYSGLPRECDTYSPDLQDIERFGIPSYVFDYIAVLNGRNVRLL